MKTISIDEFKKLVARDDWRRELDHEVTDFYRRENQKWSSELGEYELATILCAFGWASKTSTLDDIKITYIEGFNYDIPAAEDTLSVGTEGQDDVWSVEGVSVIDEFGDELSAHELADYLDTDFRSIDYTRIGLFDQEMSA